MKTENIAETIQINGKTLSCHHCGNTTFFTLKGRIVTIAKIKWGYEELKRPTTCYVCSVCNNINEFLDK
ncbi:MAG: hypothetical protein K8R85_02180 [Bacteroidetes bacterium]|nr:hypothetical protein [Bacteroidota bacterium]